MGTKVVYTFSSFIEPILLSQDLPPFKVRSIRVRPVNRDSISFFYLLCLKKGTFTKLLLDYY